MNEVWNLDRLYNTIDDPAFASDLAEMKALAEGFGAFSQELGDIDPIDGLRRGIDYV